jgi:hypothetical protein
VNCGFFYSHHSARIRNRDFTGVFLNEKLEEDGNITLEDSLPVFTAEFTHLQEGGYKQFSHYENVVSGDFQQKREARFHGGTVHGFSAFIIKDEQFDQLEKPFPFYSRLLLPSLKKHPEQGLFVLPLLYLIDIGSYDDCVLKLNRRLYRFYEHSQLEQRESE